MTNPDPEQIAAGLTKAQRGVLDEICDAGPAGLGFGKSALFMRRRLITMGLTERRQTPFMAVAREILTPLGLAVRDHLKGSDNG